MQKRWRISKGVDIKLINNAIKEAKVNKYIASILVKRGLNSPDDIEKFLNPKLKHLHSPKHIMDMDKGVDIIISAIKENRKIVIYGDYDCDGVTSTTIMYKGLTRCGANVSYHIPDRIEEGYGMNSEAVKKLHAEGFEIILTCDNGISCVEQIALAKSLGMKVVVTDHHEVPFYTNEKEEREDILPDADAIINPKRHDCLYPFKHLCGAGVAFKFVHTLFHNFGIESKELMEFIEIAAIGTICDVVDLIDENRIIVSMGLKMLNETKNIGLKALIKEIGYEGKKLRAGNIGFQIGPCINATGRLDTASLSVELLLCQNKSRAEELAAELRRLNIERQGLTERALEDVIELIENSEIIEDKVLVVYMENLHESLAGIIAGRIRERYNRPAYVITKAKDKAKGSGRSIEEYDMFEEISKCKDVLLGAGGHPMAAGFSLLEENIPLFRKRLNDLCTLSEEDLITKIDVDDILDLNDISFDLIQGLEMLEPFGKGNKDPLFLAENLVIERIFLMGQNRDHVKFICKSKSSSVGVTAVCFSQIGRLREALADKYGEDSIELVLQNPLSFGLRMDLLFKPIINEWNNSKSIQMQLVDFRISE
jgi:single-stranded-DNA-specific exonuclease